MRLMRACAALLLLSITACDRDVRVLARRPAPVPRTTTAAAREPWISPPIEEHDDYVLDFRALSERDIVAAVKNDDTLRVARTHDGGRTWSYAPVEVPAPRLTTAYFIEGGAGLEVLAMNGLTDPVRSRIRVNALTFTSSSSP
jgi:hypothetical protein